MKIYTDEKQLKLKRRIGMGATIGGLLMMFIAVVLTFQSQFSGYAWLLSFGGLIVAMAGTYHINRWVRPPLAHDIIGEGLKHFNERHVLFNYIGFVSHLLLTPKGLVAIHSKRYDGPVTYDAEKAEWQSKFSFRRFYAKGLTAEGLGDPSEEVTKAQNDTLAWLQVHLPEHVDQIPVAGLVLFIDPNVKLNVAEPPIPISQPDMLKKEVRRLLKRERTLPRQSYNKLREVLEAEAKALVVTSKE